MIWIGPIRQLSTAMPTNSRSNSNGNGWRTRSVVLAAMAAWALSACSTVVPIETSRMPERLPDGRWAVTDGWMQERYEGERLLRFSLERCEAAATPEMKK